MSDLDIVEWFLDKRKVPYHKECEICMWLIILEKAYSIPD